MEEAPDRPGLFRWRAGNVPPGKHKANVYPFDLQQVIEVGPEGERNAEIRIGEPADVTVKLLDAETGESLEAEAPLHWSCPWPAGVRSGGLNSADWSPETKLYHLRAPAGELELSTRPDGYRSNSKLVEARPGKNELTLKLEKGCGFIVSVEEGEKRLPYDLVDKKLHISEVEGSGTVTGWSGAGEKKRLTLSNPGTYEVTLDKLDGYAPVEPLRIEIRPGQYAEHVVRLRREQ
jgi:hypothetical protein